MQSNVTAGMRSDIQLVASGLPPAVELWLGGSGAADIGEHLSPKGALVLNSLPDFEQHLARLKRMPARQAIV
jgi:hypothetical protein